MRPAADVKARLAKDPRPPPTAQPAASHVAAAKNETSDDELLLMCRSLPLFSSYDLSEDGNWSLRLDIVDRCFSFIDTQRSAPPEGLIESGFRWIAEQEYLIGTVLLSFAPGGMDSVNNRWEGKVRPKGARNEPEARSPHPMLCVMRYVTTVFPQWGDSSVFASLWQQQYKLVVVPSSPSSQRIFELPGGTTFSSAMECGNLTRVERRSFNNNAIFHLWTQGDAESEKRLWFRFSVSSYAAGQPLCLRLMNLTPNLKLYKHGMRPVWRSSPTQPTWTQVREVSFVVEDNEGQLSFYVVPPSSGSPIEVAFTVPYGYNDLLRHITNWHATVRHGVRNIRFEERVLGRSLDGRKLHLLIITSQHDPAPVQDRSATDRSMSLPFSHFQQGKKIVLISGRVHPGEVTASHALHGLISFLVSSDKRAAVLRDRFIFFIVPMLNPDGVARGYTRLDQNGVNLNRRYASPTQKDHPTVFALKNVFEHLQSSFRDRFMFYMDFHSHASQPTAFVFGNYLPHTAQTWNMFYAKLIEVHSPPSGFSFDSCKFGKADMSAKDGTSRVIFGSSILHSYTMEVPHFTLGGELECSSPNDAVDTQPEVLSESAAIGRACLLALLDYCQLSNSDQLASAGGIDALVRWTKAQTMKSAVKARR